MKILPHALAVILLMTTGMAPFHANSAETGLAITGLAAHPLQLSLAELRAMPQIHVAVMQTSGYGPVALDCTGPGISALLQRASPNFGQARNAALAHTLLITADDGYAVALSFGEFDPDYGKAVPILATDCGAKPLTAPRLIVPGDGHAGRAVAGVVSMEIR